MNRECHGDWIPSMKMYRCLYDGKFVVTDKKPAVCSNCNRNALPSTVRRPKVRTLVMRQVRIKIGREYRYFTYEVEGNPLQVPSSSSKR